MKSMSNMMKSSKSYWNEIDDYLNDLEGMNQHTLTAKDMMVTGFVSMPEDSTVQKAIQRLMEEDVKTILIFDKNGRPVGAFSHKELALYEQERPQLPVNEEEFLMLCSSAKGMVMTEDLLQDWMSKEIVTVNHDDDVDTIYQEMVDHDTQHLYVEYNNRIVGVVHVKDVISAIVSVEA